MADNEADGQPKRVVRGLKIVVFAAILVAVLFGAIALLSSLFGVMVT